MANITVKTKEEARVAAWNACYNKSGQNATDASADAVLEVVLKKLVDFEEALRQRNIALPVRIEV